MHHGYDLYAELTEVHLQDLAKGSQQAGKSEALAIAQRVASEGNDKIATPVPSPLIASPSVLHAYMTGQARVDDVAQDRPYPITNGGAWLTTQGRLIVVELRQALNEVTAQTVRQAINTKRQAVTPITVDKPYFEDKPKPPPGLTKQDEGTSPTVIVASRSAELYQMEWNPQDRMSMMSNHAYFHFSDDASLPWKPLTTANYAKLGKAVLDLRRQGSQVTQKLPAQAASAPRTQPAAPRSTPAGTGLPA